MKYSIKEWDRKDPNLIQSFVSNFNLCEAIDYDCNFLLAYDKENELVGIAGINLNYKLPRFEHIIMKPHKSSIGFRLMLEMERYLKDKGYQQYTAYILNTREYMQKYALKWGMESYSFTDVGIWFYKNL